MLQFFQQATGINLIVFYSTDFVFSSRSSKGTDSTYLTIGTGLILLATAILSGFITNKIGRRIPLLFGQGICAMSMLFLAILNTIKGDEKSKTGVNVPFDIFMYIFIISFGLTLGPTIWLYNAEILSEKGVSLATTVNWVCCFLIGLFIPATYFQGIKQNVFVIPFYVFSVFTIVGFVFVYYYVVETKGLDYREIIENFERFQQGKYFFRNKKALQHESHKEEEEQNE